MDSNHVSRDSIASKTLTGTVPAHMIKSAWPPWVEPCVNDGSEVAMVPMLIYPSAGPHAAGA